MTMVVSISIDRTSLEEEDPLVVDNDSSEALWIDKLQPVNFDFRRVYAPDSQSVPGSELLSAVLEASEIPLTIYARGTSTADKNSAMAELEAAVSQFTYTVTLTIDGVSTAYTAEPCWPQWSYDSGMAAAYMAVCSLVIPVNPPTIPEV